jgi:hypothetical protein
VVTGRAQDAVELILSSEEGILAVRDNPAVRHTCALEAANWASSVALAPLLNKAAELRLWSTAPDMTVRSSFAMPMHLSAALGGWSDSRDSRRASVSTLATRGGYIAVGSFRIQLVGQFKMRSRAWIPNTLCCVTTFWLHPSGFWNRSPTSLLRRLLFDDSFSIR